jgi:hypothetical protein
MVQFLYDLLGIVGLNRTWVVDSLIADLLNHACFLKHGLREQMLEAGFMQQSTQTSLIRHAQTWVMTVEPVNDGFEGKAGMKTGGAGIARNVTFRPHG